MSSLRRSLPTLLLVVVIALVSPTWTAPLPTEDIPSLASASAVTPISPSWRLHPMINIPSPPSTPLSTASSPPTARSTIPPFAQATPPPSIRYITVTQPGPIDVLFNTVLITETVTATVNPTLTSPPTPAPAAPIDASTWSLVSNFGADLSAELGVSSWAWGQKNVAVLSGIPASAWATPATSVAPAAPSLEADTSNEFSNGTDMYNSTVMQVFFPNGSINPGSHVSPTGGTGMYLTPLELSAATNVTLEYSVFFPVDFDFVKGGKLPGLFGGHKGCSGGQESEDCFSTRLMFRSKGMGEMYLYVPKGSQPASLCSTLPVSYCDTQYGLSIGRGAWSFSRGAWSNIRQDVTLNTPGIADGSFQVFVNDALVLKADAVMFRKAVQPASTPPATSDDSDASDATPTPDVTEGGLLGGLLGSLTEGAGGAASDAGDATNMDNSVPGGEEAVNQVGEVVGDAGIGIVRRQLSISPSEGPTLSTITQIVAQPIVTSTVLATSTFTATASLHLQVGTVSPYSLAPKKTVTFTGIMFDTFFGGSQPDYATPRDQYAYFNRLSLRINA